MHHLQEKTGNTSMSKAEVWALGDALMEYHLKQRCLLGDDSEMTLLEIAELSGIPYRDIMEVYNSAIEKAKLAWTKTL